MAEREQNIGVIFNDNIKQYVNNLYGWDSRIVRILGKERMMEGYKNLGKIVCLACIYFPEPKSEIIGNLWITSLLIKDEFCKCSHELGIENQIDLGFMRNNRIYLPSGEILHNTHKFITV